MGSNVSTTAYPLSLESIAVGPLPPPPPPSFSPQSGVFLPPHLIPTSVFSSSLQSTRQTGEEEEHESSITTPGNIGKMHGGVLDRGIRGGGSRSGGGTWNTEIPPLCFPSSFSPVPSALHITTSSSSSSSFKTPRSDGKLAAVAATPTAMDEEVASATTTTTTPSRKTLLTPPAAAPHETILPFRKEVELRRSQGPLPIPTPRSSRRVSFFSPSMVDSIRDEPITEGKEEETTLHTLHKTLPYHHHGEQQQQQQGEENEEKDDDDEAMRLDLASSSSPFSLPLRSSSATAIMKEGERSLTSSIPFSSLVSPSVPTPIQKEGGGAEWEMLYVPWKREEVIGPLHEEEKEKKTNEEDEEEETSAMARTRKPRRLSWMPSQEKEEADCSSLHSETMERSKAEKTDRNRKEIRVTPGTNENDDTTHTKKKKKKKMKSLDKTGRVRGEEERRTGWEVWTTASSSSSASPGGFLFRHGVAGVPEEEEEDGMATGPPLPPPLEPISPGERLSHHHKDARDDDDSDAWEERSVAHTLFGFRIRWRHTWTTSPRLAPPPPRTSPELLQEGGKIPTTGIARRARDPQRSSGHHSTVELETSPLFSTSSACSSVLTPMTNSAVATEGYFETLLLASGWNPWWVSQLCCTPVALSGWPSSDAEEEREGSARRVPSAPPPLSSSPASPLPSPPLRGSRNEVYIILHLHRATPIAVGQPTRLPVPTRDEPVPSSLPSEPFRSPAPSTQGSGADATTSAPNSASSHVRASFATLQGLAEEEGGGRKRGGGRVRDGPPPAPRTLETDHPSPSLPSPTGVFESSFSSLLPPPSPVSPPRPSSSSGPWFSITMDEKKEKEMGEQMRPHKGRPAAPAAPHLKQTNEAERPEGWREDPITTSTSTTTTTVTPTRSWGTSAPPLLLSSPLAGTAAPPPSWALQLAELCTPRGLQSAFSSDYGKPLFYYHPVPMPKKKNPWTTTISPPPPLPTTTTTKRSRRTVVEGEETPSTRRLFPHAEDSMMGRRQPRRSPRSGTYPGATGMAAAGVVEGEKERRKGEYPHQQSLHDHHNRHNHDERSTIHEEEREETILTTSSSSSSIPPYRDTTVSVEREPRSRDDRGVPQKPSSSSLLEKRSISQLPPWEADEKEKVEEVEKEEDEEMEAFATSKGTLVLEGTVNGELQTPHAHEEPEVHRPLPPSLRATPFSPPLMPSPTPFPPRPPRPPSSSSSSFVTSPETPSSSSLSSGLSQICPPACHFHYSIHLYNGQEASPVLSAVAVLVAEALEKSMRDPERRAALFMTACTTTTTPPPPPSSAASPPPVSRWRTMTSSRRRNEKEDGIEEEKKGSDSPCCSHASARAPPSRSSPCSVPCLASQPLSLPPHACGGSEEEKEEEDNAVDTCGSARSAQEKEAGAGEDDTLGAPTPVPPPPPCHEVFFRSLRPAALVSSRIVGGFLMASLSSSMESFSSSAAASSRREPSRRAVPHEDVKNTKKKKPKKSTRETKKRATPDASLAPLPPSPLPPRALPFLTGSSFSSPSGLGSPLPPTTRRTTTTPRVTPREYSSVLRGSRSSAPATPHTGISSRRMSSTTKGGGHLVHTTPHPSRHSTKSMPSPPPAAAGGGAHRKHPRELLFDAPEKEDTTFGGMGKRVSSISTTGMKKKKKPQVFSTLAPLPTVEPPAEGEEEEDGEVVKMGARIRTSFHPLGKEPPSHQSVTLSSSLFPPGDDMVKEGEGDRSSPDDAVHQVDATPPRRPEKTRGRGDGTTALMTTTTISAASPTALWRLCSTSPFSSPASYVGVSVSPQVMVHPSDGVVGDERNDEGEGATIPPLHYDGGKWRLSITHPITTVVVGVGLAGKEAEEETDVQHTEGGESGGWPAPSGTPFPDGPFDTSAHSILAIPEEDRLSSTRPPLPAGDQASPDPMSRRRKRMGMGRTHDGTASLPRIGAEEANERRNSSERAAGGNTGGKEERVATTTSPSLSSPPPPPSCFSTTVHMQAYEEGYCTSMYHYPPYYGTRWSVPAPRAFGLPLVSPPPLSLVSTLGSPLDMETTTTPPSSPPPSLPPPPPSSSPVLAVPALSFPKTIPALSHPATLLLHASTTPTTTPEKRQPGSGRRTMTTTTNNNNTSSTPSRWSTGPALTYTAAVRPMPRGESSSSSSSSSSLFSSSSSSLASSSLSLSSSSSSLSSSVSKVVEEHRDAAQIKKRRRSIKKEPTKEGEKREKRKNKQKKHPSRIRKEECSPLHGDSGGMGHGTIRGEENGGGVESQRTTPRDVLAPPPPPSSSATTALRPRMGSSAPSTPHLQRRRMVPALSFSSGNLTTNNNTITAATTTFIPSLSIPMSTSPSTSASLRLSARVGGGVSRTARTAGPFAGPRGLPGSPYATPRPGSSARWRTGTVSPAPASFVSPPPPPTTTTTTFSSSAVLGGSLFALHVPPPSSSSSSSSSMLLVNTVTSSGKMGSARSTITITTTPTPSNAGVPATVVLRRRPLTGRAASSSAVSSGKLHNTSTTSRGSRGGGTSRTSGGGESGVLLASTTTTTTTAAAAVGSSASPGGGGTGWAPRRTSSTIGKSTPTSSTTTTTHETRPTPRSTGPRRGPVAAAGAGSGGSSLLFGLSHKRVELPWTTSEEEEDDVDNSGGGVVEKAKAMGEPSPSIRHFVSPSPHPHLYHPPPRLPGHGAHVSSTTTATNTTMPNRSSGGGGTGSRWTPSPRVEATEGQTLSPTTTTTTTTTTNLNASEAANTRTRRKTPSTSLTTPCTATTSHRRKLSKSKTSTTTTTTNTTSRRKHPSTPRRSSPSSTLLLTTTPTTTTVPTRSMGIESMSRSFLLVPPPPISFGVLSETPGGRGTTMPLSGSPPLASGGSLRRFEMAYPSASPVSLTSPYHPLTATSPSQELPPSSSSTTNTTTTSLGFGGHWGHRSRGGGAGEIARPSIRGGSGSSCGEVVSPHTPGNAGATSVSMWTVTSSFPVATLPALTSLSPIRQEEEAEKEEEKRQHEEGEDEFRDGIHREITEPSTRRSTEEVEMDGEAFSDWDMEEEAFQKSTLTDEKRERESLYRGGEAGDTVVPPLFPLRADRLPLPSMTSCMVDTPVLGASPPRNPPFASSTIITTTTTTEQGRSTAHVEGILAKAEMKTRAVQDLYSPPLIHLAPPPLPLLGLPSAASSSSSSTSPFRISSLSSLSPRAGRIEEEAAITVDRRQRLQLAAPEATEILPWLFVGGELPAGDAHVLLEKGMTGVVNTVAYSVACGFPQYFEYLPLFVEDRPDQPIFSLFPMINRFIEKHRCTVVQTTGVTTAGEKNSNDRGATTANTPYTGGKVFIHCHQGVSRSCSFVIAYLMWFYHWPYTKAFEFVRKRRTICSPNPGFYVTLQCWERELQRGPAERSRGFAFAPFEPPQEGVPRTFRVAVHLFRSSEEMEREHAADPDAPRVLQHDQWVQEVVVVSHADSHATDETNKDESEGAPRKELPTTTTATHQSIAAVASASASSTEGLNTERSLSPCTGVVLEGRLPYGFLIYDARTRSYYSYLWIPSSATCRTPQETSTTTPSPAEDAKEIHHSNLSDAVRATEEDPQEEEEEQEQQESGIPSWHTESSPRVLGGGTTNEDETAMIAFYRSQWEQHVAYSFCHPTSEKEGNGAPLSWCPSPSPSSLPLLSMERKGMSHAPQLTREESDVDYVCTTFFPHTWVSNLHSAPPHPSETSDAATTMRSSVAEGTTRCGGLSSPPSLPSLPAIPRTTAVAVASSSSSSSMTSLPCCPPTMVTRDVMVLHRWIRSHFFVAPLPSALPLARSKERTIPTQHEPQMEARTKVGKGLDVGKEEEQWRRTTRLEPMWWVSMPESRMGETRTSTAAATTTQAIKMIPSIARWARILEPPDLWSRVRQYETQLEFSASQEEVESRLVEREAQRSCGGEGGLGGGKRVTLSVAAGVRGSGIEKRKRPWKEETPPEEGKEADEKEEAAVRTRAQKKKIEDTNIMVPPHLAPRHMVQRGEASENETKEVWERAPAPEEEKEEEEEVVEGVIATVDGDHETPPSHVSAIPSLPLSVPQLLPFFPDDDDVEKKEEVKEDEEETEKVVESSPFSSLRPSASPVALLNVLWNTIARETGVPETEDEEEEEAAEGMSDDTISLLPAVETFMAEHLDLTIKTFPFVSSFVVEGAEREDTEVARHRHHHQYRILEKEEHPIIGIEDLDPAGSYAIYVPGTVSRWFVWCGDSFSSCFPDAVLDAFESYRAQEAKYLTEMLFPTPAAEEEEKKNTTCTHPSLRLLRERRRRRRGVGEIPENTLVLWQRLLLPGPTPELVIEGEEPDDLLLALA